MVAIHRLSYLKCCRRSSGSRTFLRYRALSDTKLVLYGLLGSLALKIDYLIFLNVLNTIQLKSFDSAHMLNFLTTVVKYLTTEDKVLPAAIKYCPVGLIYVDSIPQPFSFWDLFLCFLFSFFNCYFNICLYGTHMAKMDSNPQSSVYR
jgi:hypothetical protein